MKIIKLLLFLAVVGVAYQYWTTHQPKTGSETLVSANGFIALPSLAGADLKQVVVFAPENCPKRARSDRTSWRNHSSSAISPPFARTMCHLPRRILTPASEPASTRL